MTGAANKGGRPKKPVIVAMTLREKILNHARMSKHKRGALNPHDLALCLRIAEASHGTLTPLVKALAKQKSVSRRTAWTLVPEARRRGLMVGSMLKRIRHDAPLINAIEQDLKPDYPDAYEAVTRDLVDSNKIGQLLIDAKPSQLNDIVDFLEEINKAGN
jgi:hypothetical protein